MKATTKKEQNCFNSIRIVIMLVIFNLTFYSIQAQWNPNTFINLQISSLTADGIQTVSTSDEKTWVAFYHYTGSNYDMRAQLLDATGNKLLGTDGVLVSNQTSGSAVFVYNVCVDDSNNLIIAFQDDRIGPGSHTAVLYKISQTGAALWDPNGVVLGGGLSPYPAVLSNGETVVAWSATPGNTINMQKVSAAGTVVWPTPIVVKIGTSYTIRGQIVANLNSKFTMVYQKRVSGVSTTLFAQQFDNSGTALYPPLQISDKTSSSSRYYSIVVDTDTTYYGYHCQDMNGFHSFLQRINPDGTIPWGMNGSNFCTAIGSGDNFQNFTEINMTPGSNYLWSVCTFSTPSQGQYGVYIQKFLKTTGERQFSDAAKIVYSVSSNNDQQRGTLAVINDTPMFMSEDASHKLYATRLDGNGNFLWPGNRLELGSTTNLKGRFGFSPDGLYRCAGVWTENRGTGSMGYAQGVSIGGLIGIKVATQGNVPATITTNGGTIQIVDTIFPLSTNQSVTWSIVQGTGMASISTTGLVTAITDGNVWAKAVSVQDITMKDSLQITISGQVPLAPLVITLPATNIGFNDATFNGSVNANYYNSIVTFQWGLTTAYGNTIAATPSQVTGNSYTAVLANLTGLNINTTYHFRCVATNAGGTSNGLDQVFVSGCPSVGPAGTISGSDNVCVNATGNVYTVGNITNATGYIWTVPAGSAIISGQNTPSITVNFGTTSGNISVYGTNGCSNGLNSDLSVSVNPLPVPTITGSNSPCLNSGDITYTTESGLTNYSWTVSTGGSIVYGNGTNQVDVSWNMPGNQYVTVDYTNNFGCTATTPTSYSVTVNTIPDPAGSITGPSQVCAGTTGVTYSITPVANAVVYIWTLPAGATIISGDNTNNITVDFAGNASSGNITVMANNLCGYGNASSLALTVDPAPPAPVVTVNGLELTSSAPAGNQWYYDGVAIQGATSQTYTVTLNTGYYWCVVTLNDCSSEISNKVWIEVVGTEELPVTSSFTVYPVPNNGLFTVSIQFPVEATFNIMIYNQIGSKVFEFVEVKTTDGKFQKLIDLRPISNGIYSVVFLNSEFKVIRKVLVNR